MTCDHLADCCGCCPPEEYSCSDCEFCRRAGCEGDGPDGACLGSEECCFCAPRCLRVTIGSLATNSDRNCVDCCYNPTLPGQQPCSGGDNCCPECVPEVGTVENPECQRMSGCSGECPNNDSCSHFNGTYIISINPGGTCGCSGGGWQLRTPTNEPGVIDPCCTEFNELQEQLFVDQCCEGGRPFPPPTCDDCWYTWFDEFGNVIPCPLPLDPADCNATGSNFSACGVKNGDASSSCGDPWALTIASCIQENTFSFPQTITWKATITLNGLHTAVEFRRVFIEGIDWPMGGDIYAGWIECDTVSDLPIDSTTISRRSLCDWGMPALPIIAITCPTVFWQVPQALYYEKNNQKYINLTEVKRRKLLEKTQKRIKNMKIADIDFKQENYLFREEFENTVRENVLKGIFQNDLEKFVEAEQQSHKKIQSQIKDLVFYSNQRPAKIRRETEIAEIYNTCKNCPFFSELSICMINNKSLKPTISLDNFITNAEAECPDYPRRWEKSENLEPQPPLPLRRRKSESPPPMPKSNPKIL